MTQSAATFHGDAGSWRRNDRISDRLLQIVDVGLAGVILVAPLFLGGRHPVGHLVFALLSCIVLCTWMTRQALIARATWTRTAAHWLLACGVLLVLFQLAPLPLEVLDQVSPSIRQQLPLWNPGEQAEASLGQWAQLSLYPAATQGGLVLLLSYAALFVVTVQRIKSLTDIQRLLRWVALATALMAVVGLLGYFLSNGKFLWVYHHPFRDTNNEVHGPFENQNHFAHFIALGVAPLIWLIQQSLSPKKRSKNSGFASSSRASQDRERLVRLFGCAALALAMFAGLLTFSRGGVIAIAFAAMVTTALLVWTRVLSWRALAALGGAALLLAGGLFLHGFGDLAGELETVSGMSLDSIDRGEARRRLWDADLKAAADYQLTGAGVGTHVEVYPTYYDEPTWLEYQYAESGYLQVLVTAGGLGLALVLAAILLIAWWGADALRRSADPAMAAAAAALIGCLVVSIAHSVVDFVWFIPACAATTTIMAACLCRLRQLARYASGSKSKSKNQSNKTCQVEIPRWAWTGAAAASVLVSAWMIHNRLGPARGAQHWDQFYGLSLATGGYDPQNRNRGMSAAEGEFSDNIRSDQLSLDTMETLMRHLENTLAADSHHARAHLRMASVCIRRFELAQLTAENAMALSQIRDAALASNFPTAQAQNEWLSRAVGENRKWLDQALSHARRAVELCPLQGRGYIYLSQLAFLDSPNPQHKHLYVAQALKVRPYSGDVLIPAGAEALFAGDEQRALKLWKHAFDQGPQYQEQIAAALAPTTPADFMLANFQPDLDGTHVIYTQYHQVGMDEEAQKVALAYVTQVEDEAQQADRVRAASLWHKAQGIYRDLQDGPRAVECARRAVKLAPHDFDKRRALARRLMENEIFNEAEVHLRWCLRRQPDDEALQNAVQKAHRESMRTAAGLENTRRYHSDANRVRPDERPRELAPPRQTSPLNSAGANSPHTNY